MSYSYFAELPRLEDIEPSAHTNVLVAHSRVDQSRIRAAVDRVFDAHPALGTMFEPRVDTWTSRPGGGWGWAVEPPGRGGGRGGRTASVQLRHVHRPAVRCVATSRGTRAVGAHRQPTLHRRPGVAVGGRRVGARV